MTTAPRPSSLDPATLTRYLSPERLRPYMLAARGRSAGAFTLYRWNMAASAAVYETLHLAEVVLRNAMDTRVRAWNTRSEPRDQDARHTAEWTLDPRRTLGLILGADLDDARRRAEKAVSRSRSPRRPVTHGDVVAQLTLGSWRYMLPARNLRKKPAKRDLWETELHKAFPHAPCHTEVVDDVETLWLLRNRVAHLEPLLRPTAIENGTAALRRVIGYIEPAICTWHDTQSRVAAVLASRPVA